MFRSGGNTPNDMMKQYERNYGGKGANRMNHDPNEARGAMCLCVPAKFVLGVSCIVTFILGLCEMSYASYVYSVLDLTEHPGWQTLIICLIVTGLVVAGLSILGAVGARSRTRTLLTPFFLLMSIAGGVAFGSVIYVFVESARIESYLTDNWKDAKTLFGASVSRDEAEAFLRRAAVGLGVTFLLLLLSIVTSLGAATRLMGTGYTFVAANMGMVALAAVSVGVGVFSMGKLLPVVYILLFVSAAALLVAAFTGSCGAKTLNRECLAASSFILTCVMIVYFFVVGWSYPRLTGKSKWEEEWSVVFSMALASGYWSTLCLVLGLFYLCEKRNDIKMVENRKQTALDRI